MSGTAEQSAATLFAALGDATRLRLLQTLSDGESRSIAELASHVTMTRQAVTKHLQVLETAGVVDRQKVGRESRYRFIPAPLSGLREYLKAVSAQRDESLEYLRHRVED